MQRPSKKTLNHRSHYRSTAARKVAHPAGEPLKRISAAILAIENELNEQTRLFDQQIEAATIEEKNKEKAFIEVRSQNSKLRWGLTRMRVCKKHQLDRLQEIAKALENVQEAGDQPAVTGDDVTAVLHELGMGPPLPDEKIPTVTRFDDPAFWKRAISEARKVNVEAQKKKEELEPKLNLAASRFLKTRNVGDEREFLRLWSKLDKLPLHHLAVYPQRLFELNEVPPLIPIASGLRRQRLIHQRRVRDEQKLRENDPLGDEAISAAQFDVTSNLTKYRYTKRIFHLWEAFSSGIFLNNFGVLVPSVEYTAIFLPREITAYLERFARHTVKSDLASNAKKYFEADKWQKAIFDLLVNSKKSNHTGGFVQKELKKRFPKIPNLRTIQRHIKVFQELEEANS